MTWTPERLDQLRLLVAEGMTARQIANRLGNGISRGAVMGELDRLGLKLAGALDYRTAKPRTTKTRGYRQNRIYPRTRSTLPLPPTPIVRPRIEGDEPVSLRRTILTVANSGECKWPHGDPHAADFNFCGHPTAEAVSYCPYHCQVAFA